MKDTREKNHRQAFSKFKHMIKQRKRGHIFINYYLSHQFKKHKLRMWASFYHMNFLNILSILLPLQYWSTYATGNECYSWTYNTNVILYNGQDQIRLFIKSPGQTLYAICVLVFVNLTWDRVTCKRQLQLRKSLIFSSSEWPLRKSVSWLILDVEVFSLL